MMPVVLGLVVLACAWMGPLPALAEHSFAAHMTGHMAVVALAAPLFAIGLAGGRWDPVIRAPGWFAAVPLSIVEFAAVWAWHAPALHHAAHRSISIYALEQASFLITGLLFWLSVVGGARMDRPRRRSAAVIALALTFGHMTLLGALLALSPRPLYGHGSSPIGLSALADQHLGGVIMLGLSAMCYVGGGLWLSAQALRTGDATLERP